MGWERLYNPLMINNSYKHHRVTVEVSVLALSSHRCTCETLSEKQQYKRMSRNYSSRGPSAHLRTNDRTTGTQIVTATSPPERVHQCDLMRQRWAHIASEKLTPDSQHARTCGTWRWLSERATEASREHMPHLS